MPDIVQPFVVIPGLAVGLTATTVITDSAAIPVAVSSFNGLTGAVTGVTTGTVNTFVALQSFSSGISAAGGITFANDISVNNLTIGQGPVSGSSNTAIGEFALASLQTGGSNTAVGSYALSSATAGNNNVAIGDSAMRNTTNAGNNNFAIGAYALDNNAGGSDNIAIGNYALLDNLSGEYNVVIGHDALDANQTGSRNTAIGYSSLSGGGNTANSDNLAIGYSALLSLNSGTQNTAIGTFAGRRRGSGGSGLLSATGGIYIGYDARASANAQTNEIVIGNLAVGLGSNTAVIGQNTQTSATIYGLVNAPSGISAAGATFMGNINLQNAEFIRNTTNGRIDLMPAPASASAFGMYVDTTSWGFGTKLGTIRSSDNVTNVGSFLWDAALVTGNDVDFSFGANQAYKIRTTATNNNYKTLQLGLPAGTVGYSSALAIMDYAQAGSSVRQPNTVHTHPNVYIYSAGNASANDFIRIEHDRTNANIVTGQTSGILIQPGSGWLGVSGGISASGGVTFASKVNAIQGVVSGYPRLEWCGLTSGFDIIPTGWQNMSAPIGGSPTVNDAYFAPIFISSRMRITGIGHQTGADGSGNTGSFIFGLYDSDNYGFPRNRLYASASTTLSTGSFATQRVTGVNTTVNPGQHWIAIVFSAASLPVAGLGRLGTRMKFMTPTSGSVIGQGSADGLRRPQGGFTLAATQGTTFTNVEGPFNPCIFYNGESI